MPLISDSVCRDELSHLPLYGEWHHNRLSAVCRRTYIRFDINIKIFIS